jgi:hypothetical protein
MPSSANKPMANARALELADACLAATGGDDAAALNAAEPGEWPSDFAVVVARWDLGGGGGAYSRAAGASAVVAAVAVACVALVLRRGGALGPAAPVVSSDGGPPTLHSTPATTLVPTVAAVTTAYLVPNALEAAAVAVVGGHTTLVSAACSQPRRGCRRQFEKGTPPERRQPRPMAHAQQPAHRRRRSVLLG